MFSRIISLIISITFLIFGNIIPSGNEVYYVKSTDGYTEAAEKASPGDRIILADGVYKAPLTIPDGVTVYCRGTDAEGTEISNNFIHDNGSGNARCTGIYIDNNCANIDVKGNTVTNNSVGIQMNLNMINCRISSNVFIGNSCLCTAYAYPDNINPSMYGSEFRNNIIGSRFDLPTELTEGLVAENNVVI